MRFWEAKKIGEGDHAGSRTITLHRAWTRTKTPRKNSKKDIDMDLKKETHKL
jgi:hypothetical protein